MLTLRTIRDLSENNLTLLKECTVRHKIDHLLEEMNVKEIPLYAEYDFGAITRRTNIIHASSLGMATGKSLCGKYTIGCGRNLYYSYTGAKSRNTFNPKLRRILDTGVALHSQLQAYLEAYAEHMAVGHTFTKEVDMNPDTDRLPSTYDISGHTDGIYEIKNKNMDLRFGIEIKTISSKGFAKLNAPLAYHKVQGAVYQHLLDLPVMLFLYYNKDTSEMAEYPVVYDSDMWEAVKRKVQTVRMAAINETELPPKEVTYNCNSCTYAGVCEPPTRANKNKHGDRTVKRLFGGA